MDLKTEREKKNISLAQIMADTHISRHYLQSIEEGRYSDLPGGMYDRAFIKAYCKSIRIDPKEILEQYEAQVLPSLSEKKTKSKITHVQRQNTFSISGPILIWTIMLLISAAGIFFSRGWISEIFSRYFTDKSVTVDYNPKSMESPSDATSELYVSPEAPGEKLNVLKPPSLDVPSFPAETENTNQGTEPPSVESQIAPKSSVGSKLRVEIVATEPCWVLIEIDGIPSIEKTMEPGEKQEFNAIDSVHLKIGNAGGIQMKINDKPVKPLGTRGEVVSMDVNLGNLKQFIDQSTG